MPDEEHKMRTLPIDHAQLVGLRFCGSGKDSEATIEFAHGRKAVFALTFATMELSFDGPISIRSRDHGDTEVVMEIAPAPGQQLILNEAAVRFYGNDDEWDECLRHYVERGTLPESVMLRLRVGSRPNVAAP